MKRFGFVVFACLLLSSTAWAQFRTSSYQPSKSSKGDNSSELRKFYFGGGGSLGFGTGYVGYTIMPIIGYRVTDDFSVGSIFSYTYFNNTYVNSIAFKQYTVGPFARYNFKPLFVQTELDFTSSPHATYASNGGFSEYSTKEFTRFLIGLGYSMQMGRQSAFNALVMYDLLYTQTEQGVFGSPVVVRVFVTF